MNGTAYFKQALLMLRVMPHVTGEECFALKGGTAINFFVRDMPRQSVDIDLTYVPLEPRDTALANVGEALHRIATGIQKTVPGTTVQEGLARGVEHVSRLTVGTAEEVAYDELVAVRESLIDTINETMMDDEKKFLLSIKQGEPDWNLMPVTGIDQLPAIQWKLLNIRKMKKEKHAESLQKLRTALGI